MSEEHISSPTHEDIEIDLSFLIPVSPCGDSTEQSVLDDLENTAIADSSARSAQHLHEVHGDLRCISHRMAPGIECRDSPISECNPLRKILRRSCGGQPQLSQDMSQGVPKLLSNDPSHISAASLAPGPVAVTSDCTGTCTVISTPAPVGRTEDSDDRHADFSSNMHRGSDVMEEACQQPHTMGMYGSRRDGGYPIREDNACNTVISDEKESVSDNKRSCKKSLGTWSFNARKRKRVYISLTGKKLSGPAAVVQCRRDKTSEGHPSAMARMQLAQATLNGPILTGNGCNSDDIRITRSANLAHWGLPVPTLRRYASAGITSLFPWQVDCLLCDDAAPLRGGSLIYTAPTSGGKTLVAEVLMLRRLGIHYVRRGKSVHGVDAKSVLVGGHRDSLCVANSVVDGRDNCENSATLHNEMYCVEVDEVRNGSILFVVPFISLAEEKAAYLQEMWADMVIGVRTYHGEDDGATLTDDVDVAVCTIERANVILTQLLDQGEEGRLLMVVVDELHLISDSRRGFLLEVLLSKLKFCCGNRTQIVAMSATLPNVSDLSSWLGASLYSTSYRPVNLETRLCIGGKLYKVDPHCYGGSEGLILDRAVTALVPTRRPTVTSSATSDRAGGRAHVPLSSGVSGDKEQATYGGTKGDDGACVIDEDRFLALCAESIRSRKSLMIFCSSKRRCEVCVERITELLERKICHTDQGSNVYDCSNTTRHGSDGANDGKRIVLHEQRVNIINELRQTPVGVCPLLRRTVLHGVAYHHAGLTVDERKIVEQGFRTGAITVLCTTTTLSAGVNLPAHRVIIRSPHMGNTDLSVASFRQMCGRAGRMHLDSEGEAILIVPNSSQGRSLGVHLMSAPMDPLLSSLHVGSGGGIEKLLLEMIYCQKVKSTAEVEAWTLAAERFLVDHQFVISRDAYQQVPASSAVIATATHAGDNVWTTNKQISAACPATELVFGQEDAVEVESTHKKSVVYFLRSSPLGKASSLSGISPRDAIVVLASLSQARRRLILQSGFHAVYLATPPAPTIEPCWNEYERLLDSLLLEYPDVKLVCELLGVSRGDLFRFRQQPPKFGCTHPKTCFYRRLHAAILLFSLIQEMPLTKVCKLVCVQRGQLQLLQKEAAAFCGMAVSFCRNLNWTSLASVLETYIGRLGFGVRPELVPLSRLGPEMPGFRARAFYQSGITSPEQILYAPPQLICSILMDCLPYEGRDPLLAVSAMQKSSTDSALVVPDSSTTRTNIEESCQRLALSIINKAKRAMRDEMEAAYRQSHFLLI